jgi:uncharacterized protein (TIGR00661 family)
MKYLFLVQGEGRGHLIQALTLKEKLEQRGHQIVGIIIGANAGIQLPSFFQEQINVPLFLLASPGFAVDKKNQGIKILPTIRQNLKQLPQYRQSLRQIKKLVGELAPDALINLYEPLGGLYYRWSGDQRPLFCLGNQYLIQHPAFKFPRRQLAARLIFQLYTKLITPRSSLKIALSLTALPDLPAKKLVVCPPIIRPAIKEQKTSRNNFLLVYMLNPGYSANIINWSSTHPGLKIEAFWNHPEAEETEISPDLTFHNLSGQKFIDLLASCRAFACTGGFDSIAEAAYLQKALLITPSHNHFEQRCNAVNAVKIGLAVANDDFDLSLLVERSANLPTPAAGQNFKAWVDNNDDKILNLLTDLPARQ